MKNKGFLLIELLVSMGFVMVIMLLILNTSISINKLLNKEIKQKKINEELALIYKNIATSFSTKNITSIKYENNMYIINYSKPTVDKKVDGGKIETTSNISLIDGTLSIDEQKFHSTKYLKYNSLNIKKNTSNTNNKYYYIILTINYDEIDSNKDIKIYYVNDPINTLEGIEEVLYG